jgi:hypothetical protein
MPPFPRTGGQVRVCEGGCGRLTRNTKMSKADYPDTVTRATATHCTSCQRVKLIAEGKPVPKTGPSEEQKEARRQAGYAAAERARTLFEQDRLARRLRQRTTVERNAAWLNGVGV